MIGRFASHPDRNVGELPVRSAVTGQRYSQIHLRLTRADFQDPLVRRWIHEDLYPRLSDPVTGEIAFEVL